MKLLKLYSILSLGILIFPLKANAQKTKPNLIIIHTDEHNFRTLGCYRDLLSEDQAFVWGKGVEVKTPNIDRIANEGAICNNFYASSPVCTPSRASFVSGNYPIKTGSYRNDIPMKDEVVTFAEVLSKEGYATSYLGKWHLDGDAKPGFAPKRKFGFNDNTYMFNRGHWKGLDDVNGKPALFGKYNPKTQKQTISLKKVTKENFTTDYLTTKTLEILERDKNKPFCIMVSIPDPHTPNTVRAPYDTMFSNLHFEKPKTLKTPLNEMPSWAGAKGKSLINELDQAKMQRYFGMVKCIDDNVGRILDFLDKNNLTDNTIVVFTSDHGDLLGEHHKNDKSNPYEASAKIPFVLRFPSKVKAGKVIRKAFTTADFTPTILGLMNAPSIKNTDGVDASTDFSSSKKEVVDGRITYMTASNQNWIASVSNRYKLVLSTKDKPWLIDLEKNPDEDINFYKNPDYKLIANEMQTELLKQAKQYNDPAFSKKKARFISK
ncbi:sulfatase-like hydrolase/transferase [Polaribacter sp. Z014]|uniref:sulfatase-like hydrolase/transferase n=1 Tax=Polaribacter sp. Z014 TaxID=2927126 RepID=UPI002020975B|nr:sulfatase-like hydrolase/transferase [Polaribacter sp. Z014]MCL7764524.1 sulfatase-like hydrolase/transferase [Polaribacter sp. Z014]